MRKPTGVPMANTQHRAAEQGYDKVDRLLIFIRSTPWIRRTQLSERCINEATHAYEVQAMTIARQHDTTEEDAREVVPRLMCCLCDRQSTQLYQVRFTRHSRRAIPTHAVHSEWFTIHPNYLPFLQALINVARCRYYLPQEPNAVLLYQQTWGNNTEAGAADYLLEVIDQHTHPPDWDLVHSTAQHINATHGHVQ